MLYERFRHARDDRGFSLIELLVVILIIGVLAAIAIPAFLNQRAKAHDASSKSNINTAEIAEQAYATDHDGRYTSADTANAGDPLVKIEPTLHNRPWVIATATTDGFTLVAASASGGDVFTLTFSKGTVTRTCTGTSGGCTNGSW